MTPDIIDSFRVTLEQIAMDAEHPLVRDLEVGFRHSPLSPREREQRYSETCVAIAHMARVLLHMLHVDN